MIPPCPEVVCLWITAAGKRNNGGKLLPLFPACVASQWHLIGHYDTECWTRWIFLVRSTKALDLLWSSLPNYGRLLTRENAGLAQLSDPFNSYQAIFACKWQQLKETRESTICMSRAMAIGRILRGGRLLVGTSLVSLNAGPAYLEHKLQLFPGQLISESMHLFRISTTSFAWLFYIFFLPFLTFWCPKEGQLLWREREKGDTLW